MLIPYFSIICLVLACLLSRCRGSSCLCEKECVFLHALFKLLIPAKAVGIFTDSTVAVFFAAAILNARSAYCLMGLLSRCRRDGTF